MQSKKITNEDISDILVSSLPTRPTSDYLYGGEGYSSQEMKAAFDRLSLYIIEEFNKLLDDITAVGDASLAGAIPTDIETAHTLFELFEEIKNGTFINRIKINGEPLTVYLAGLEAKINK